MKILCFNKISPKFIFILFEDLVESYMKMMPIFQIDIFWKSCGASKVQNTKCSKFWNASCKPREKWPLWCWNQEKNVQIYIRRKVIMFLKFGSCWIHNEFMVNLWIKIVFNFIDYFIYLVDAIDVNKWCWWKALLHPK
jgi:hypothetical protein